jgi:protein-S-isoprenylcysteine O-methyltransferase Ste14
MMVQLGNFFFRYRNGIFPLAYALLFVPSPRLIGDDTLAALFGLAFALGGQILRAVTIGLDYIVRGGQNRTVYANHLVQGGMFAHSRNPLYLGNYMILLGVGLIANSLVFIAIAIPFFTVVYAAIIAAEENYLRGKFGDEFEAYCRQVNRLLPKLSGLSRTLSGMRFNWPRLISAEYGTTFIWIGASILVTLKSVSWDGRYGSSATLVSVLWVLLALNGLGYGLARFLKKSGILAAREKLLQPAIRVNP